MNIEIEKIKFEGNILRVLKATVTEMKGINNNEKYDFDLYQIEARSPMSTKEISLTVDFIEKKISGDIIAFGDWYDLDKEPIIEILTQIQEENKTLRTIDFLWKSTKKGKLTFFFLVLFGFICFDIFRKNF